MGAAMGRLEAADRLRDSSGESALFVSEEFAFQEGGRNGCTVQLHEGPIAAAAPGVNGPRDEFFACAGFTLDDNCGVGSCHKVNVIQYSTQTPAGPYQRLKLVPGDIVAAC
jgi:hypothetical protein